MDEILLFLLSKNSFCIADLKLVSSNFDNSISFVSVKILPKKFFKDNNNKIKSRSEGPGGLSDYKYFSNPYVGKGQSAVNAPKGVFPKG